MNGTSLRRTIGLAALAAVALFALAAPTLADDWPNWRGPNHDGWSTETGWLDIWPPVEVWSKDVGMGYSSVAVSEGRLYTMGWTAGKDTVYCLDANTGTEIWSDGYSCGSISYEGTRCTPTVHDGKVYTYSHEGALRIFDKVTGTVLHSATYSSGKPGWGFACSPLIEGNLVMINGQYGNCTAISNTPPYGVAWSSSSGYAQHSSPIAFTLNSQRVVAFTCRTGSSTGYLKVRDAITGAYLWSYTFGDQYLIADPLLYDGNKLYYSTGYGPGGKLIRLNVGGTTTDMWGVKHDMDSHCNTPVLLGNHMYGCDGSVNGNSPLKCVDMATGNAVWSHTDSSLYASAVTGADNKLICMHHKGYLVVIKATPTAYDAEGRAPYKVRTSLSSDWWTAAVLADGMIYCRHHNGTLVALRVSGTPTDSDSDTIGDIWETEYFPTTVACVPTEDEDGDGLNNEEEYDAGTDPTNAQSRVEVQVTFSNGSAVVTCPTIPVHGHGYDESMTRYYSFETVTDLVSETQWQPVPGSTNIPGDGNAAVCITAGKTGTFFRAAVWME